ncbi:hypothetical protein SAMN00017477_1060 [Peptoniphilus asaccharolyticus DSM 20463]|uniref:Uncharacterized protein n=1 Tax=Peptoniphilus asaccharolyticus DSM 20463 TaxID=573058 RepID=A0A1W1V1S4_PEPAS|nr:hypothetical protein [Peptoniphilus asaccharolyticus]MBL7575553.1 hypothetical protein [Peptoniphilus asaccharolyticus]SMB87236.1 hypothetical protein SAMN00017477_1060 [Peptoniphilus asaccharolyticus DSM 20463]
MDEEILNELKEIKELLRIIVSNTEQREITLNPLVRFEGMKLYEIQSHFKQSGEKYFNQ